MKRILISELHTHIDESVTIAGWVDVRRDHGKLMFIDLRDRSGMVQLVILPAHQEAHVAAQAVRSEWVVEVQGEVHTRPDHMKNADQANGDIELEVTGITILGAAKELPFEKDAELNIDTLLDYRPLTLRRTREHAIFHVQHEIVQAYRDFLISESFTEFQAPKLVGEDAEGGGNVFKVDYFHNRSAYLATSPQLYKQLMVGVFERVFAVGNVFRAEKHSTTRHLNEYTSLDAEFGFITDHTDIMNLETRLMHFVCERLRERCASDFEAVNATLPLLPEKIPTLTMREAQKIIFEKTGIDHTSEPDLEPSDERFLCEYAAEHFNSDFIFVTHYPTAKRPFYAYADPHDPEYTRSFDLLFRGVEITTGGQRIHDYDTMVEKIKARNLDPEKFAFYLQGFKFGMPPHGGWGMGLERLTQKFLQLENVKEATLFPREINRIDTLLSE